MITKPDAESIEQKSSAITLSDMEVFIFPELMYSLVLANIMSPRIWLWRDDPWFDGLEKMKPYRRITRLKQYIMDHYVFNLDLDTWGLTEAEKELKRFSDYIDEDTLSQSNALFGYEGDKYYFDIDIRSHFGLDKYNSNVIPYWKTETVEAMDAFRHKSNYNNGAGECVSLATLYAAALFIVAEIPLKDIFLIATPLHSQNFVDLKQGILTNNRRLVTKNMWFNGTALSAQARRALENERVTIVTHETGHIHTLYNKATIDPDAYDRFSGRLSEYLKTKLTKEILGSFFRNTRNIQKCFQLRHKRHGADYYIGLEKAFTYEDGSPYKITDNTREKLINDIDAEVFECCPLKSRIIMNDLEDFIVKHRIDIDNTEDTTRLKSQFASDCLNAEIALEELIQFCHVKPQLPDHKTKSFQEPGEPLGIEQGMNRDEIFSRLESIRETNAVADLAFYSYRDLTRIDPEPYLHACIRRNPASLAATGQMDIESIADTINALPNESIYDGPWRLAQPDEVWNYQRGDGVEKAVLLANILQARNANSKAFIHIEPNKVVLDINNTTYEFESAKQLPAQKWAL